MTTPEVRAAAVAALGEAWYGSTDRDRRRVMASLLDALIASPERARALIAALLTEEALAAAMKKVGEYVASGHGRPPRVMYRIGIRPDEAAAILRALTQPDTRSEP